MTLAGPGRTPLTATALREETLADMNRGRLRGWAALAVGALIFFAIASWPNLGLVALFALCAAGSAVFFVRVTLTTFSDVERDRSGEPPASTGEPD
jgi:hypothetical protein